jgi:hypothetical protein
MIQGLVESQMRHGLRWLEPVRRAALESNETDIESLNEG